MSIQTINPLELKTQALKEWHEEKIQLCTTWINDETNQRSRDILQRSIYLCKLGENIGGEMNSKIGRDRPVLVISNNIINRSSNITIVPLTKRLKTVMKKERLVPKYRSHYFLLKSKYDFLNYDSAVKTEDERPVSKVRLTIKLGEIDSTDFKRIIEKHSWITNDKI